MFRHLLMICTALLIPGALCFADDKPAAPAQPQTRTITIPYTTAKYEFVKIPGGKVVVDGKTVEVKPFWIGRTELTWDCFDIWALALDLPEAEREKATAKPEDGGTRPTRAYAPPDRGYGHEGYPAMGMNYEGTVDYCNWLSEKMHAKFRLPTEAEFVYAAQAGTGQDPTPEQLDKIAWFKDNANKTTHPVGKKAPNDFGLYDMYGNVGEWVQMPDPNGDKFVKGGSFKDTARYVNSKARNAWTEDWQTRDPQLPKSKWWMSDADFAGFRIVCEEDPALAKPVPPLPPAK